ncbi:hypothetical protein D2E26_1423 [Bifidobacterium dolichotidis]|uniref:Uncharacterized protein n=1 Tax=Bifidobacterium dolichotidis TaxID=2306976 RepID=A0A430FKX0_9BIFI|nr:hypothetical protein D2E26_1423 [Bifidobacterium dolichotidis]
MFSVTFMELIEMLSVVVVTSVAVTAAVLIAPLSREALALLRKLSAYTRAHAPILETE